MASETKSELVDELSSQSTKAELVELLGSRLRKDEISKLLDDDSDGTKDELLKKLSSRTKDELVQAVQSRLTKDEIGKAVDAVRDDSDDDEDDESAEDEQERRSASQQQDEQPTPAPIASSGAVPFRPGARVRVDLSGLPTLGIFLGKGASAAGTITGVNADRRTVRVYLDACFDGEKEIFFPPERIVLDR